MKKTLKLYFRDIKEGMDKMKATYKVPEQASQYFQCLILPQINS